MAELELIPLLALERTFFFGVGASNHDTRKLCASYLNPIFFYGMLDHPRCVRRVLEPGSGTAWDLLYQRVDGALGGSVMWRARG